MEKEERKRRQSDRDRAYGYWLYSAPGIGNKTILKLTERFGSARAVYEAGEKGWRAVLSGRRLEQLRGFRAGFTPWEEYEKVLEKGLSFITMEDEEYPSRLREIPDAPYALFYKGRLPETEALSVALIGARDCSEYGSYVARALGEELGKNGVQVISGMARGIDGISQEAALDAGGASFGILGCGVDVCYPASNRRLYEKLEKCGGLLSAYPPGMAPRSGSFPPRNRIISGLADAVVVVEARRKSGTLITVDMALEQGREVYAVPGRITDRLSDGCNYLLTQGAGAVITPELFMEELRGNFPGRTLCGSGGAAEAREGLPEAGMRREMSGLLNIDGREKTDLRVGSPDHPAIFAGLTIQEQRVLGCLEVTPLPVDRLLERLPGSSTYAEISRILMRLCLLGAARQVSCGYFCRRQASDFH